MTGHHVIVTVERLAAGHWRALFSCAVWSCDLRGSTRSNLETTVRAVADLVVTEHARQTERPT